MIHYLQGDCRHVLQTLSEDSIHCCVTSPPYFNLRDYGVDGQIGTEESPDEYVRCLVEVFRKVRRVLRPDGTLWLNLGDSYVGKNLAGIPWRVAFALQNDDWILRSDVIWHKPNVMPESVKDRPTKAHEYIFLLAKTEAYFYDAEAIKEPLVPNSDVAYRQELRASKIYESKEPYKTNLPASFDLTGKNKRTIWTVPTCPFEGAHCAVFPPDLIRPCILAGCPAGGIVVDPFGGSGTTALVAEEEGRNAILIELNPSYIEIQKSRTQQTSLLVA